MTEKNTVPLTELHDLHEDFERKYCLYAKTKVADLIEEYTEDE